MTEYVQPIHQTVKDFVLKNTLQWPIELIQGPRPRLTGFLYLLKCATGRSRHPGMSHRQSDFLYYARQAELEPGHVSPSEISHCIQSAFHQLLVFEGSQKRIRDWCQSHNVFRALPAFEPSGDLEDHASFILLTVTVAAGIRSFPAHFKDEFGVVHAHLRRAQRYYSRLSYYNGNFIRDFVYHLAASAATWLPNDWNVDPLEALKAAQISVRYISSKKALDAKLTIRLRFSSGSTHTDIKLVEATPLATLLLARACTSASSDDRLKAARYLLECGADPNSEILVTWSPAYAFRYRQTGLHHCARFESGAMVRLFLEHKADPNVKDSLNITPLMYAALRDDPDVIAAFRHFDFEPQISSPSKEPSPLLESQAIWPWLLIPMQVGSALSGRAIIRQRRGNRLHRRTPNPRILREMLATLT
jgi:hypothetical protein